MYEEFSFSSQVYCPIHNPSLKKRGRGDFQSATRIRACRRLVQALCYAVVSIFLLSFPKLAPAQAQPKVTVAYAAISPIFAGVWMAKEVGAFEKQGLKADLVYISSGSITVQAMVGGNLDMTVAASNAVVSSILRGACFG